MDLKHLTDIPAWDWPEDTPEVLRRILQDPGIVAADRELAAELATAIAGPELQQELPFLQLDPSLHNLNADARALDRRGNYRVLYHQAWRQPDIGRKQAPWILVRGGERYGEHFELEGSVRLLKSRFLHFETNLWLTRFASDAGQAPDVGEQDKQPQEAWPPLPAYPVLPVFEPVEENMEITPPADYLVTKIYSVNTSRLVRKTNQLHYLDHPTLGVLVQVTKYELPVAEEQDELQIPDIEEEIGDVADDGNSTGGGE